MAGFDVVRVINEPTAPAIADLSEASLPDQRMMVFAFGSRTLDVTVMDITTDGGKRSFKVLSMHGDTFLGGVDFDREIVQMMLEKIRETFPCEYEQYLDAIGKGEKGVSMVRGSSKFSESVRRRQRSRPSQRKRTRRSF